MEDASGVWACRQPVTSSVGLGLAWLVAFGGSITSANADGTSDAVHAVALQTGVVVPLSDMATDHQDAPTLAVRYTLELPNFLLHPTCRMGYVPFGKKREPLVAPAYATTFISSCGAAISYTRRPVVLTATAEAGLFSTINSPVGGGNSTTTHLVQAGGSAGISYLMDRGRLGLSVGYGWLFDDIDKQYVSLGVDLVFVFPQDRD